MPDAATANYLDPGILARIADYNLLARTTIEGFIAGLHRSVYHGFGNEFVHYRHYSRGDDLKYVDWKVYARLNRYQTKVFQEETNTNCYLVLDASASMSYQGAGSPVSKLHYAKIIAACLAYLVTRQGDNAGLYAYGPDLRLAVAPSHRSGHLHQLNVELARLQGGGRAAHTRVCNDLNERFHRRGLVVIISDFLDADATLFSAIRRFRVRHHDCILFHLLDPDELDFGFGGTVRFVDSETGAELVTAPAAVRAQYQRDLETFLGELARFAAASDLDYNRLSTSQSLAVALAAFLHRRESFR